MNDERTFIEVDDALSRLFVSEDEEGGRRVHTFRGGGMMLIGADWDLEEVEKFFAKHKPELSGPMATKMNHGVFAADKRGGVFFETKKETP